MPLSREEREELRRRIDAEKRRRLGRAGGGRVNNLAMACYEQAQGDPVQALWLAIRLVQRRPELLGEPVSSADERERRNEQIRALRERRNEQIRALRERRNEQIRALRERRNEQIRALRREGQTLREIAERFGLSVSAVARITAPWR